MKKFHELKESVRKTQESYTFYILKNLIIMCLLLFRLVESEGFTIFMDFMTNGKWEKFK